MKCGILYIKKRKLWVIKAFDRSKNQMVAWVTGSRSAKTFRRLYEKVKHLKNCIFYTDSWGMLFPKFCPALGTLLVNNILLRLSVIIVTSVMISLVSPVAPKLSPSLQKWLITLLNFGKLFILLIFFHLFSNFSYLSLSENSQIKNFPRIKLRRKNTIIRCWQQPTQSI